MIIRQRLSSNIIANVLQAIVSAALLFALYRYINLALGVEQLGVWSVVLATVSASRIVDLGLSAGVIRFVARDCARNDFVRAGKIVDTVVFTLMIIVGIIASLLYPLLAKLLPHLFQTYLLEQALAILPFALISLWLAISAAVFQGALDGCQRMDLRAFLVVTGQGLLLTLSIWLIPQYGLVGLAWAQIGQSAFLMVGGRFLLCRTLPTLSFLPRHWNIDVLREMLGYGANLQVATICILLFDPVTKLLMAHFGGPIAVGYFEMANQVVLKARALIVNANQAIVPYVTVLAETTPTKLTVFYKKNIRALMVVALPCFSVLIIFSGAVSWLLIGSYQPEFVLMLGILCVAWMGNSFSVPAYFINMGTGRVGWNTLSHLLMGMLNIFLGWMFGQMYGAGGVVFGYVASLVLGSLLLVLIFQHQNTLNWRSTLAKHDIAIVIIAIGMGFYGLIIPPWSFNSAPIIVALTLPPLGFLSLAAWLHPMRQQLMTKVRRVETKC